MHEGILAEASTPSALTSLSETSDGSALAPLIVGGVLAVGYLVKLGIDLIKGKPQQELAERKERQDYIARLKEENRSAHQDIDDLRKVVRHVRHERDLLKEYAWDLRGDILGMDPSLKSSDLRPFPKIEDR